MSTERTRPDPRLALLLLAAALAVRLLWLGRDDLSAGEVTSSSGGGAAAASAPLVALVLAWWSDLVGSSQFLLRLPSALIGAVAVVPALSVFHRLLAQRAAGWAGGLFALHPLLIEVSREAGGSSLLVLSLVVAIDGALTALDEGWLPWTFWVATALGALVHVSWAFGLLALGAWLARERPAEGASASRKRALVGLCLSAAVLVVALTLSKPAPAEPESADPAWETLLQLFAGAGATRAYVALYAAFAAVWCWAAFDGWRSLEGRARGLAAWLVLGVPLLALAAAVAGTPPWGPVHHLAAAVIGLVLLGGAGAARPKGAGLILAALLVAVLGVRFVPPRTHWSDVATTFSGLAEAVGEDDVIRTPDAASAVVLGHYLRREGVVRGEVHAGTSPQVGYWCACRKAVPQSPHWEEPPPVPEAE